jgi:hypothetical protein
MFRQFALFSMVAALTACVATEPAPVSRTPYEEPVVQRSGSQAIANYRRVTARVEPVAERACRSLYPQIRMEFCDFTFQVLDDPKQPPNAFQSIGRANREK